MELKQEENVNAEYEEEIISDNKDVSKTKNKKSLKKWGIVGVTLAVAGIVGYGAYCIYENANSIVGGTQYVDSIEVRTYNMKYSSYLGTNRNKSVTGMLIDLIIVNNSQRENMISISTSGIINCEESFNNNPITNISELSNIRQIIASSKNTNYNIEIKQYYQDGYIKEILITAVS